MTCCRSSRTRIAGLAVLVALSAAACGSKTEPTPIDVPYSVTDITIGTGTTAVAGATVATDYIGWLYDNGYPDQKGYQFDNSLTSPSLFTFVIGSGVTLQAFEQAFIGMKIGGVRRVEIPPAMVYGSAGRGNIPPNATLIFQIYLYEVIVPE